MPGAKSRQLRGRGANILQADDRPGGGRGGVGDGVEAEAVQEGADRVEDRARRIAVALAQEPGDDEEGALLRDTRAVAAGVEELPQLGEPLGGSREAAEPLALVRQEGPAGEQGARGEAAVGDLRRRPGRRVRQRCAGADPEGTREQPLVHRDPGRDLPLRPRAGRWVVVGPARAQRLREAAQDIPGVHLGARKGVEALVTFRLHQAGLRSVHGRSRPDASIGAAAIDGGADSGYRRRCSLDSLYSNS